MADLAVIEAALAEVLAQDRGRCLAALIRRFGDFQLAEDALQDATASALVHWGRVGPPNSPIGWLLTVAARKAIDCLRRQQLDQSHIDALGPLQPGEAMEEPEMIPDDRLRLIFTCCHPALDAKSRVALTLRSIAGLTTAEIATAFLDAEPTMGQRLSRAKAKISAARIPYVVPGPQDWDSRLNSVLAVIYLIFNAGYSAPDTGRDLCAEALFLAELLDDLCPRQAEVEGLLALMRLTHARSAARIGPDGASVPPPEQDRRLWDGALIATGQGALNRALGRAAPGPYQIKAAIATLNLAPPPIDWRQIAALYNSLLAHEPTPVVQLNRAVAVALAGDAATALREVEGLSAVLEPYQPYHAARAEILSRLGRRNESIAAYDRAIALCASPADALFLRKRRSAAMN